MSKKAFKSICLIVLSLAMVVFVSVSAGAADDADVYDTAELINGEMVTGTVLNKTFTVTTPYSSVSLEKDTISEIKITPESENQDVIMLDTGGLVEGTIEEAALSVKLVSGEIISLEKRQCKKIIIKRNNQ